MIVKASELYFGQTLCDMHHGFKLPACLKVVRSIKIQTTVGCHLVQERVRVNSGNKKYQYVNKCLVICDEECSTGNLIAGVSYDGWLTLYVLEIVKGD
jgi:hypothetical protein